MAAAYVEAGSDGLRRLAYMLDIGHRGELTAAMAGEARMPEDRFGLCPISRRRLGWTIAEAEVLDFTRPSGKRRLRAVDPNVKGD